MCRERGVYLHACFIIWSLSFAGFSWVLTVSAQNTPQKNESQSTAPHGKTSVSANKSDLTTLSSSSSVSSLSAFPTVSSEPPSSSSSSSSSLSLSSTSTTTATTETTDSSLTTTSVSVTSVSSTKQTTHKISSTQSTSASTPRTTTSENITVSSSMMTSSLVTSTRSKMTSDDNVTSSTTVTDPLTYSPNNKDGTVYRYCFMLIVSQASPQKERMPYSVSYPSCRGSRLPFVTTIVIFLGVLLVILAGTMVLMYWRKKGMRCPRFKAYLPIRKRRSSTSSHGPLTQDDPTFVTITEPRQERELFSIGDQDGGDDGRPSLKRRNTEDDDYFYDEIFEKSEFVDKATNRANKHLTVEDEDDEHLNVPDLVFKKPSKF